MDISDSHHSQGTAFLAAFTTSTGGVVIAIPIAEDGEVDPCQSTPGSRIRWCVSAGQVRMKLFIMVPTSNYQQTIWPSNRLISALALLRIQPSGFLISERWECFLSSLQAESDSWTLIFFQESELTSQWQWLNDKWLIEPIMWFWWITESINKCKKAAKSGEPSQDPPNGSTTTPEWHWSQAASQIQLQSRMK